MSDRNVILIGFMGSGKTSVGEELAEALGYQFLDTDQMIQKKAGKSISRIFSEDGEPAFRQLESQVMVDLAKEKRAVVSTGGGAPLRSENMTAMKRAGLVICLTASPEELYQRVKNETHRPLLQGHGDLRKQIRELLDARKEAYSKADHTIDTTSIAVDEVVDQCIEILSHDTRCDF